MKRNILIFAATCFGMVSCKNTNRAPVPVCATAPLPFDSANKMLGSYLNSIDYENNDTDLNSIVVDAEALRRYLDSNRHITGLKLMLAHRLDYINSGHAGQYAGFKADALTIIIAGFDNQGDYIYLPDASVLDFNSPCPPDCPPGAASNPFLTN